MEEGVDICMEAGSYGELGACSDWRREVGWLRGQHEDKPSHRFYKDFGRQVSW